MVVRRNFIVFCSFAVLNVCARRVPSGVLYALSDQAGLSASFVPAVKSSHNGEARSVSRSGLRVSVGRVRLIFN